MSKIIAAINITIDGNFDHTRGLPDEEIHEHYTELLSNGSTILYGRKTYELMEFWQAFIENPSGEKSMDDFAIAINEIPKIVFSHTLKNLNWKTAKLASKSLEEKVLELKQETGKDILIGSRSLIIQLMKLNLIDEYQLCIHPVIAGGSMPLFEGIEDRIIFKLTKTKTFKSGAIILYFSRNT